MHRFANLTNVVTAVVCAAALGGCATDADHGEASAQQTLASEDDGWPWGPEVVEVDRPRGDRGFDEGRRPASYPRALGPVSIKAARPPWDRSRSVKVLDVAGWSTEDRGAVQLWTESNADDNGNQLWRLHPRGDSFIIENEFSGKCLDETRDTPLANGNKVYQYSCSNEKLNQRWEFIGRRGEYGALRNKMSGRCLDLANLEYRDGASVQSWDCTGAWNQSWNIW
jgi:hypothetical protein